MFRIGEFSRLSRVSVRMLRHYDQLGLLTPAQIDPSTNYRFYAADQLPRLNRILTLRELGFSLEQIGALLETNLPSDQLLGMLEGGELTGKYNTPSSEPKRSQDTGPRIKALAAELVTMAEEHGCTLSKIAINWVRQRSSQVIPILGARSEKQLRDNLGCLSFQLDQQQFDRLDKASPIDLGFPHSFLNSDHVRSLIFGKTFDLIEAR